MNKFPFDKITLYYTPVEITRENWIIGNYIDEESLINYEVHYCKNEFYKDGLLIDDVWAQNIYDYKANKKIDIYILEKEQKLLNDFTLDKGYCYFLSCKNIEKYFIHINNLNAFFVEKIQKYKNIPSRYINISFEIKPVLSIITTVYNNSFLLEQTLQSVINQNSDSFEYIIKDANSNDNFDEVVNRYKKYGIRILKSKDTGIYDGMNQGIRTANGTYVQILNSDDVFYYNNIINKYIKELKKEDADAYCSDIKITYQNGKTFIRKADLSKLRFRSCINHTSLAMKLSDYIKLGGFDLNLSIAADCDLTIKIVKAGLKIKHLDIVCVKFRAAGASNSAYTLKMLKENLVCRYRYSALNIIGYCYTILQFLKIKIYKSR
ncbi:MAG: hypothetical protein BHV77_08810 [Bacteroides sp. 43_108]|nr:MAG: hypothetical protein BHV77_08810 [Bacteroides sp. 43_108]